MVKQPPSTQRATPLARMCVGAGYRQSTVVAASRHMNPYSLGRLPVQADNCYWEESDPADAGWVEGHHGRCGHRSHVCSSQRTMDFVLSVLEHQWKADLRMAIRGFLARHGIVRNAIRRDILCFALPGITVWYMEVRFCARDGLSGFWGTIWGLVKQPQNLFMFPVQSIIGMALVIT